jgi:hypothetical protein
MKQYLVIEPRPKSASERIAEMIAESLRDEPAWLPELVIMTSIAKKGEAA